MVDDQEIAETTHPVGEYDAAGRDGTYLFTLGGADEQALPGGAATFALTAESAGEFAAGGQSQLAAQGSERAGEAGFRQQFIAWPAASGFFGRRFGLRQPCQFVNQVGQALFIALQRAYFLALRADLRGERLQYQAPRLRFPCQVLFLAALQGLDIRQLGGPVARFTGQALQFAQVVAQAVDQSRLGARNVACVVDFARRGTRTFSREQHLHITALVFHVFVMDQARQALSLGADGLVHGPAFLTELLQACLCRLLLHTQVAQGPAGFRDRAFRVLERVGRLGAAALGTVDFLFQAVDTAAQVLELVGVGANGAKRRQARQHSCQRDGGAAKGASGPMHRFRPGPGPGRQPRLGRARSRPHRPGNSA